MAISNRQIIILAVILLAGLVLFVSQSRMVKKDILQINGQTVKIEVADETAEITRGLSGKPSLCPDCGMLFVFPDYQIRTFWMKEMNFPLDIIWIKDEIIVGFEENIPLFDSQGNIRMMASPDPVNLVLELNAGWVSKNKVKIGDKVSGLDL